MIRSAIVTSALLALVMASCAHQRPVVHAPGGNELAPERPRWVELFPHVRADRLAREVEFDAFVSPILVRDPRAPHVYLEVLVCTPGTREHETLAVARALPSHIHAALLTIGAQPGSPGGFRRHADRLVPVPPTGDDVRITFFVEQDDAFVPIDPMSWIINARDSRPFRDAQLTGDVSWRFAGSTLFERDPSGPSTYAADLGGNIVGFSTFGDEVIALSIVLSPEASVLPPEWVADLSHTPPPGTALRVRLSLTAKP